jgi:hypothetical protein
MEDLAMTRKAAPLLLLLLLTSLAGAQNLQKTLHDRYQALDRVLMGKDFKAVSNWVNSYCTPDFTFTSKDKQKYNRKAFLEGLRQQIAATKKVIRSEEHPGTPQVKAGVATVKVSSLFEGLVEFDGKQLRLLDKSESQDKWVKSGSDWKLKSIVQTKSNTQMYPK